MLLSKRVLANITSTGAEMTAAARVIIPVYNASKYLKETIMSVVNQSFKDFEIICIDDGSLDNSLEILNELSDNYNHVKYLNNLIRGQVKLVIMV